MDKKNQLMLLAQFTLQLYAPKMSLCSHWLAMFIQGTDQLSDPSLAYEEIGLILKERFYVGIQTRFQSINTSSFLGKSQDANPEVHPTQKCHSGLNWMISRGLFQLQVFCRFCCFLRFLLINNYDGYRHHTNDSITES